MVGALLGVLDNSAKGCVYRKCREWMNKLKILKGDTQENSEDETFCPTVNLFSEKKINVMGVRLNKRLV